MRRPFAVIGFTVFVTLFALCALAGKTAWIVFVVSASAALVSFAVPRLRHEAVLVCSLLSCMAACVLYLTAMYARFLPIRALDGHTVSIEAHMTDLPRQSGSRTEYALQTESVDDVPMRCKLNLLSDVALEVQPTDRLLFSARLSASEQPDGGRAWLRAYGCTDLETVSEKPTFRSRMIDTRSFVTKQLMQMLPDTSGTVLAAMLLGDSNHIPADVYARMRRSGILHIFSVSGLHLSVFAMALLRVSARRRVPRQLYVPLCAGLVLYVMAVTGFPLSCVRAGIMLLLMLAGRLFARRADALNSLGFSLLFLCMVNPFNAADVGLQLSVLGTLGVVCGAPLTERLTHKIRIPVPLFCSAVQSVVSTFLLSAGITILTMPVAAVTFKSVSPIAPITNAVMLFAAEWAMMLAAFSLPLTLCRSLAFLYRPLLLAAGFLAKYCTAVTSFFGSFSFAAFRLDDPSVLFWIAGTLLLIAAAVVLQIPTRRKIVLTAGLSVLLLVFSGILQVYTAYHVAEICPLDVGNGSAVLVKSCGKTALIGCGGTRTAYAVSREADSLQLLLLPRMTKTESAAATSVLHAVPAERIVVPEKSAQTHAVYFFYDPQVFSGETYRVGDVTIDFLPLSASSAVRLQAYGRSMLLLFSPGCDVSLLPQDWLNADMLYVRADVPERLQAENYAFVLLQGEESRIAQSAQRIQSNGGRAVYGQTVRIQKGGFIGRKAGVCGAGNYRTGTETAVAAKGVRNPVCTVR